MERTLAKPGRVQSAQVACAPPDGMDLKKQANEARVAASGRVPPAFPTPTQSWDDGESQVPKHLRNPKKRAQTGETQHRNHQSVAEEFLGMRELITYRFSKSSRDVDVVAYRAGAGAKGQKGNRRPG